MIWDKDNPLHHEIMEANKQAFLERQAALIQAQIDGIWASLPWWLRLLRPLLHWWRSLRR